MSAIRFQALGFLALSCLVLGSTFVAIAALAMQPQLAASSVVHLELTPAGPQSFGVQAVPRVIGPSSRAGEQGDDHRPDFSASVMIDILPDLIPQTPKPLAAKFGVARVMQAPMGARAEIVAERLKTRLTPEMLKHFDLFLYVSKADRGPLAQRMYVFEKQPGDGLTLAYDWAASTGREQAETNARGRRVFTATPSGYYQLDPLRMYPHYHSTNWDQDMPSAMFFDWQRAGKRTGLAIHAASGDGIAKLGSRASAGCVHLAPENAAALYDLIRANYQGSVPRFAFDRETQTISNRGVFMRAPGGELKMAQGYRVLVMVEDYSGESVLEALL
jgi:lipoprotein-anchoring transpeptidase ErfK/SrfK